MKISDFKGFEIISNIEKQIFLPKDSTVAIDVVVKAKKIAENGSFNINYISNKVSITNTIIIPIQSNPIYINKGVYVKLLPKQMWQQTIIPVGVKGTNTALLEISKSEIPNILEIINNLEANSSDNLQYILDKTFPLIYFNKIVKEEEITDKFSENIRNVLLMLKKYQVHNGGFFNNLNNKEQNQKLINYAGEFMLEAKENGYQVNEGVLNKWIRFQKREILKMEFVQSRVGYERAYTLYTMVKSGVLKEKDLLEYKQYLSDVLKEKLYLILSFIELEQTKQAKIILDNIDIEKNISKFNITEISLLLNIYTTIKNREISEMLLTRLNKLIKDKKNTSTEIVLSLNSILKNKINNEKRGDINISYQINHGESKKFNSSEKLSYLNIPLEFTLSKHIDIINDSKDTLYINMLNTGSSNKIKNSYLKQNKIYIKNSYLAIDNTAIDMRKLKVGAFYKQKIKYTNKNNIRQQISVFIPIPAGVELIYSNIPMTFDFDNSNKENLLKAEISIKEMGSKQIILIFKTVFKGQFKSYPIKTYTKNYFYFNKYTSQKNMQIN
jgi:uncharacterized protein YfaS (alpha-2-macroglobulin family)